MSLIKDLITQQNFKTFKELNDFFTSDNYNFEVKENENLYMLCFTNLSNLDSELCRQANGIIFEKCIPWNNLVHYSFAKCYDGVYDDTISTDSDFAKGDLYNINVLLDDPMSCKTTLFFEGTLIKLFYFKEKWHVGTSKCLDASSSTWSSKKSFLELFEEAVLVTYMIDYQKFLESLDSKFGYSFILQHPENKMSIPVNTSMVFNMNRVNLETFEDEILELENFRVNISLEIILNGKAKFNENYMIYYKGNRIKILSPEFTKRKELYGNMPDIGLRYIELYRDKQSQDAFRNEYVNYDLFEKIDTMLNITCLKIYDYYNKIHCDHLKIEVPVEFDRTIYQMHCRYKKTGDPITPMDISDKLISLNPRLLASMIEYKY
jgi:hypothetical protein